MTTPYRSPEERETPQGRYELYDATSRMIAGALQRTGRIDNRYPQVMGDTLRGVGEYGYGWLKTPDDPRGAVLKTFIEQYVEMVGGASPKPPERDRIALAASGREAELDTSIQRHSLLHATATMIAGAIEYASEISPRENQINPNYPQSIAGTFRGLRDFGQLWLQHPEDPRAFTIKSFASQLNELVQEAQLKPRI